MGEGEGKGRVGDEIEVTGDSVRTAPVRLGSMSRLLGSEKNNKTLSLYLLSLYMYSVASVAFIATRKLLRLKHSTKVTFQD